jgi:hypothetical protein
VVIRQFPGLKHNTAFKLFMRKTAAVESLRNVLQHLNAELDSIGEQQSAALGTITWLSPSPDESSPALACIIQPGSYYPGQVTYGPLMDLEAWIPPGEVRQIHLVTSGARVDLSDTVERIQAMITGLEPSFQEVAEGKNLMGSDVLLCFKLTPTHSITDSTTGATT